METYMSELTNLITGNTEINDCIGKIKEHLIAHPISDITDKDGHQYIDLVLEGGGVLGIALVGYTYALEQAGIRFLNIAGTSAGAINALFLAALGKPHETKSIQMLEVLTKMNMKSFVDGGWLANGLVDDIKNKDNLWTAMFPKIVGLTFTGKFGKKNLAVNSGNAFEVWIENQLNSKGITDTEKLKSNLINSNLKIRDEDRRKKDKIRFENEFKKNELAIVAADITTESKVIFPRMATLYWNNPEQIHPKHYVRASMSIPLFFKPHKVPGIPQNNQDKWKELTGYMGPTPSEVYFVDGGIVSNFPIDIFHQRQYIPLCPTFGVKLNTDREHIQKVEGMSDFIKALFNTARHTADYSFLHQNDDYKQLIAYIDTSVKFISKKKFSWFKKESDTFHWLDFDMSNEKKSELFRLGVKTAHDFIIGNEEEREKSSNKNIKQINAFDWESYKALRANLCK